MDSNRQNSPVSTKETYEDIVKLTENTNFHEKNKCKDIILTTKKVKVFRPSRAVLRGVPLEIENDPVLLEAIKDLPSNYNFEIPKTVWKIRQLNANIIALQLPEGLQIFAEAISNILSSYCGVVCFNMADVTYGACCIDDISACRMNADLLVHYGHSCLVPIDHTILPVMYVFVDIQFDSLHLLNTVKAAFEKTTPLALVSIVQFVGSLQQLAVALRCDGYTVLVPQSRPLSPGEVLGCTSPPLPKHPHYTIIALGDGRFHLESIMISNPELDTYLYNPYNKVLTREQYDQPLMKANRKRAIDEASLAKVWGILFSTLGRQGSDKVRKNLQAQLVAASKQYVCVDHDQVSPDLVNSMSKHVDAWVQVACPRLSIDWGQHFHKPLLTPYEAMVALRQAEWSDTKYPMDYYASDSLGLWTPNHVKPCPCGMTRETGCKGRRCDVVKT